MPKKKRRSSKPRRDHRSFSDYSRRALVQSAEKAAYDLAENIELYTSKYRGSDNALETSVAVATGGDYFFVDTSGPWSVEVYIEHYGSPIAGVFDFEGGEIVISWQFEVDPSKLKRDKKALKAAKDSGKFGRLAARNLRELRRNVEKVTQYAAETALGEEIGEPVVDHRFGRRLNPSSQIGGAVIAAAVLGYVLGKK